MEKNKMQKRIGILHLTASGLATILAIIIVIIPAGSQIMAEHNMFNDGRIQQMLVEERKKAMAIPQVQKKQTPNEPEREVFPNNTSFK